MNKRLRGIAMAGALGLLSLFASTGESFASPYTFTIISVPGATSTQVYGINDSGAIVGSYMNGSGVSNGFLDNSGVFTTIDVPGAAYTVARGISDSGAIVGYSNLGGFLDTGMKNAKFIPINVPSPNPPFPNTAPTRPFGISNNTHYIVGDSGFLNGDWFIHQGTNYTKGYTTCCGRGSDATAYGINNSGAFVGQVYLHNRSSASGFLIQGNTLTILNTPGSNAAAYGINDLGAIVGGNQLRNHNPFGQGYRGFLDQGGIFSTINVPMSLSTTAYGINDSGAIVGSYVNSSGITNGFLIASAPESSSIILFGTGILVMTLLTFRERKTSSSA
ncbi:MAG: hypothetical protein ACYCTV_07390 [Leptospirales bacterium]